MVKLMADSTCDLSQDVLDQYGIDTAALTIELEGGVYRDKIDITADALYLQLPNLKENPKTAMPAPAAFMEIMEKAVTEGFDEILCICMSSGTSGSYQAAVIAQALFHESYPDSAVRIHIVDSRGMSHGSGYLLVKSARLLAQGFTFDELIAFNETYKRHVKHYLTVDDLNHLIRSGRLTNASAIIGKLLNIKPIMSMRDGKGAIVARERGRKMVMNHYVTEFIRRVDSELTDFVMIGYTSDKPYAESLRQKLIEDTGFTGDVYIMQMGVAVGVHVGLGAVSLFFIEKERSHDGLLVNEMAHLLQRKDDMMKRIRGFQGRE